VTLILESRNAFLVCVGKLLWKRPHRRQFHCLPREISLEEESILFPSKYQRKVKLSLFNAYLFSHYVNVIALLCFIWMRFWAIIWTHAEFISNELDMKAMGNVGLRFRSVPRSTEPVIRPQTRCYSYFYCYYPADLVTCSVKYLHINTAIRVNRF
jgi:hypothetical protein